MLRIRVITFISGMFLFAAIAQAQGVRYDDVALLDTGRPVQGAIITVCASGSTGTPCTPTTSIFSDSGLTSPITQPGFQSGAQGNFFFYAACGKYDISFSGNGLTSRTKKDVQLGPCGNFNSSGATSSTLKSLTVATLSLAQRFFSNQGSSLTSGRFSLNSGWGTTATVTGIVGTDQAFRFQVNSSGTGQAANPTITLTYFDGTWTNDPIFVCWRGDVNSPGPSSAPIIWGSSSTATAGQIVFLGTPVVGNPYIISCIVMGR